MAIQYVSISAGGSASATAPTVDYPGSLQAGDNLLLFIASKYPTSSITTPTGFEYMGTYSGGTGTGAGAGSAKITCYKKISDGTESGTLTLSVSSGNINLARMISVRSDTGKQLNISTGGGSDNSASTAWSVTTSETLETSATAFFVAASAFNSATYTYTNYAFVQTGVSFGTKSQRVSVSTSGGDDTRLQIVTAPVSSGTGSGTVTYAQTANSSDANAPQGATIILKLEEAIRRVIIV